MRRGESPISPLSAPGSMVLSGWALLFSSHRYAMRIEARGVGSDNTGVMEGSEGLGWVWLSWVELGEAGGGSRGRAKDWVRLGVAAERSDGVEVWILWARNGSMGRTEGGREGREEGDWLIDGYYGREWRGWVKGCGWGGGLDGMVEYKKEGRKEGRKERKWMGSHCTAGNSISNVSTCTWQPSCFIEAARRFSLSLVVM